MKLWIDPGHGFGNRQTGVYDEGACAGGASEADIVLAWAKTLAWVAKERGIATYLTRDDDRDKCYVGSRARIAMEARCTHGISLHCNAARSIFAHGTETFMRVRQPGQAGKTEAVAWADRMQQAALGAMNSRDRGIKPEGQSQHQRLAVLSFEGPMALLEIGFITNPAERKKMLSRDVRLAFANAFLAGLPK